MCRSSLGLRLTTSAIETLFKFEPFFARATVKARKKIIDRADTLGVRWDERVDGMRRSMDQLEQQYQSLLDPEVGDLFFICICAVLDHDICRFVGREEVLYVTSAPG